MPAGKAMCCALCVVWCLETPGFARSLPLVAAAAAGAGGSGAAALSVSLLLLLLRLLSLLLLLLLLLLPLLLLQRHRQRDRETERDTQTQTERQKDGHARDRPERPERGEDCLSERTTCTVSNRFRSSSPFQSPYRTVLLAAAHENLEALRGV